MPTKQYDHYRAHRIIGIQLNKSTNAEAYCSRLHQTHIHTSYYHSELWLILNCQLLSLSMFCGQSSKYLQNERHAVFIKYSTQLTIQTTITVLNIFFKLVKHLLRKLNRTQPTTIYLDVSVSIRGLRQKKMKVILLPVLAKAVMRHGKKSVVRVAQFD